MGGWCSFRMNAEGKKVVQMVDDHLWYLTRGMNMHVLALDEWLCSPAGQYLVRWEQGWIDAVVPDLFGFRAIQLGTRIIDGLRENRIPHKAYLRDTPIGLLDGLVNFEALPFEDQALDLVVMPHVLEFSCNPHQVLREVERVLMPEGRVVITGFNPFSLWGARHFLHRGPGAWWPEGGNPMQLGRLKDWLKLLSIEPEFGRFGCYRFPARSAVGLSRLAFMEKAGDRWWPMCGAVYAVCAVKRVQGMRLLEPDFKRQPIRVPNLKVVVNQTSNKSPTIGDCE